MSLSGKKFFFFFPQTLNRYIDQMFSAKILYNIRKVSPLFPGTFFNLL